LLTLYLQLQLLHVVRILVEFTSSHDPYVRTAKILHVAFRSTVQRILSAPRLQIPTGVWRLHSHAPHNNASCQDMIYDHAAAPPSGHFPPPPPLLNLLVKREPYLTRVPRLIIPPRIPSGAQSPPHSRCYHGEKKARVRHWRVPTVHGPPPSAFDSTSILHVLLP